MILSLDPSSTTTGYAVLSDDGTKLIDAGKLRGKAGTRATDRVLAMREGLIDVLTEHCPRTVLIELPTEKQHTRNPERKSGMPVWAMAAGALWMVAFDWPYDEDTIAHVIPNTWTRGSTKAHRQRQASLCFPNYDATKDTGGDVSDAITMAMWWIGHRHAAQLARAK